MTTLNARWQLPTGSGGGGTTTIIREVGHDKIRHEVDAGQTLLPFTGLVEFPDAQTDAFIYDPAQVSTISYAVRFQSGGAFVYPSTYADLKAWADGTAALVSGTNADGNLSVPSANSDWELEVIPSKNPTWLFNEVSIIVKSTKL